MNSFRTNAGGGAIGASDTLYSVTKQPQQFRTYAVPNFQLALYQLQIREGTSHSLYDSYTFPLSPESVRKEFSGLANYYDVQGDQKNNGVLRVIDVYGIAPPTIMLEGTTGWKLHQSDAFKYTGLQSIQRIVELLSIYTNLNQGRISSGNQDLYELWFFDFFLNEYWAVVPIGPQGIRQSAARSLYVNYSFRLVVSRRLDSAELDLPDSITQLLAASSTSSAKEFQSFVSTFTTAYSGVTAPAK